MANILVCFLMRCSRGIPGKINFFLLIFDEMNYGKELSYTVELLEVDEWAMLIEKNVLKCDR